MYILVLGSAAGGGFPQWNCFCENCKKARVGKRTTQPRTQSSIAVSADGDNWALINASPDIRQQINENPLLWPRGVRRGTQIKAILLSDSQVDHTTGLITLREGLPMPVYCTDVVYEELNHAFPLFSLLDHWPGGLQRHKIDAESRAEFTVETVQGLSFLPLNLISNAPPYSAHRDAPLPGSTIGFVITDLNNGQKLVYAPGLLETNHELNQALAEADCALLDGTLWLDDEMIAQGVGKKSGTEMGHMPVNGENGTLNLLGQHDIEHKVLIHINNTNPILDESSTEHATVIEAGVEIATDGMLIELNQE